MSSTLFVGLIKFGIRDIWKVLLSTCELPECIGAVKGILYLGDFLPVISTFIFLVWMNFGIRDLHVMLLEFGDHCDKRGRECCAFVTGLN
jgi:hypothetical protein